MSQYRLPNRVGNIGGFDWGAVVSALLLFGMVNMLVTQYLASYFGYSAALGSSYLTVGTVHFYYPWKWAIWCIRFSATPNPVVRWHLIYSLGAISFGLIGSVLVSHAMVSARTRWSMRGSEDIHGSAMFASVEEVQQMGVMNAGDGPYIGAFHDKPNHIAYLRDAGDEHILAFAPTGSGKSLGLCVPVLLENANWSMIITDSSGELHDLTSGWRAAQGNSVFRWAPVEPDRSCRFNLFGEVRCGTPRDVSDAQNIATMMCHVPGESVKDSYWEDSAASLITGIILHESYRCRILYNRRATGRDIASALTPWEKPFTETLNSMTTFEHDPTGHYGWTTPDGSPTKIHPVVMEKAMEMVNRINPKTGPNEDFNAVLSGAKRRFEIYSDPLVSSTTGHSDLTIDQLVNYKQPVSLYIVVPLSDNERLTPLLRTILTVIFNRLTEPERIARPNKHRLLGLFEEFPMLKRMEFFSGHLPLVRKFLIKCFLIAQSTEQINDAYGDHQSIVNNCGTRIAYTPNDKDTADLLSGMTGVRTVEQPATSFSGGTYGLSSKQKTVHINYIARSLLTTDEVLRMRVPRKDGKRVVEPGDMLIFIRGQKPIYGRQFFYFFDPEFQRRASIPPLTAWPRIS